MLRRFRRTTPDYIHQRILLILFVVMLSGCRKIWLTGETEKNTFSCIMGGKIFKPCDAISFSDHEPLEAWFHEHPSYYPGSPAAATIAASCLDKNRSVTIYLTHFTGEGNYLLSDSTSLITCKDNTYYYTSKFLKDGKVSITKFDRERKILSGTFEAVLSDEYGSNRKLTIREGRFDVRYQ